MVANPAFAIGFSNPAFVLNGINNVNFESREIRKPGPKEVKLHIEQTGICGSDVHYWKRGKIGKYVLHPGQSMVLGHESSGTVVEVGEKVTELKIGDRVAVEPGFPCRYCDLCRAGLYNSCESMFFAATPPDDGTLANYFIAPFDYCYKIPDHMNFEEAAMVEPVSVAVQICKRAQLRGTDLVTVFGCGPIGLLCQAVAKALGARKVIGVDISDGRLKFAKSFAADGVYKMPTRRNDESYEDYAIRVSSEIKQEFGYPRGGSDVILEATGAEPCIVAGVYLAKPEGRFVQAGMGKEMVNFPVTEALVKQLNWTGSIRYSAGVYPTAVDLVASGEINVKKLITHRFKFHEAEKAFELVHQGRTDVIKVMIEGVKPA